MKFLLRYISLFFNFFFNYYGLFKVSKEQFKNVNCVLNSNFVLRKMTIDNLESFMNLETRSKNIELYRNYFYSGDFDCFGVFNNYTENLIYSAWINYSNTFFIKEINRTMSFNRGIRALFFDDYTHSDYRGLGIHKYVMQQRILDCFDNDIKDIYIVIDLKNTPALKTIRNFGFKRVNFFAIYFRRLAFESKFF